MRRIGSNRGGAGGWRAPFGSGLLISEVLAHFVDHRPDRFHGVAKFSGRASEVRRPVAQFAFLVDVDTCSIARSAVSRVVSQFLALLRGCSPANQRTPTQSKRRVTRRSVAAVSQTAATMQASIWSVTASTGDRSIATTLEKSIRHWAPWYGTSSVRCRAYTEFVARIRRASGAQRSETLRRAPPKIPATG